MQKLIDGRPTAIPLCLIGRPFPIRAAIIARCRTAQSGRGRQPLGPASWQTAFVAITAFAVAAPPACAQVLDGYFPPIGTAAGGIPADNSRERVAAEYMPLGLYLGNVRIDPQLTESLGYDSNVDGLREAASAVLDTSGTIIARSDMSRQNLSAELTFDDRRYSSASNQNSTSWTGSAGGTYELGPDLLGVTYDHLALVETPDQIDSNASRPVPYSVDAVLASYSFAPSGRLSFMPGLQIQKYAFDPLIIPGGYNESWRDRVVAQEDLVTRYELDPGRAIVVAMRGSEIRYDRSLPDAPRLDSNGASVLLGIDYTATDVIRYRALVGYQIRQFASPVYGKIAAPIAEASLTWTPTRLTTLKMSLLRDIQDSVAEGDTAFTYTTARIDLTHELRRNVTLSAFAAWQNADGHTVQAEHFASSSASSSQTIYTAGVSASWKLNRTITLNGSFSYESSHGSGASKFNEAVGLLAVSFGF